MLYATKTVAETIKDFYWLMLVTLGFALFYYIHVRMLRRCTDNLCLVNIELDPEHFDPDYLEIGLRHQTLHRHLKA